jgi:chromate transporter
MTSIETTVDPAQKSISEIFKVLLRLGLTSFGGPVAHIGYFRQEADGPALRATPMTG